MRKYELMYILRPDLEEEKLRSLVEKFKGLVTDNGGEITNLQEMGKRRLAYEMKKLREGYYVLMNFLATPAIVSEMDRIMKITDEVVRHLVIRDEKE
ncbi:30S ribosomal protein S6 [Microaerobacter geothermalis]|uniref:30S ribosomal protein S6 n=1 Tax=Microaerobacter geothermalis TaxID=674972 RepID=UPI001F3D1264|nr:30S ribosomal protein S6 [Microaerobacter geothermalis]MCF6094661.1 30S ribosomal protein S6 [Microaerobacter geothermalis]